MNKYNINPLDFPEKVFIYVDIDAIKNGTGEISLDKTIIGKQAPSRARRIARINSVVISTVRPNLKGFAYINTEMVDTIFSTGFAILESSNKMLLLDKMVYYQFMYSDALFEQLIAAMPKGQYPSINATDINNFMIIVPSLEEQQRIITEIEGYESAIAQARAIMDGCAARKQEILNKYL